MIDIHTHLLPAVDDGAESLEEAVEMARLARADGIEALVATPHASSDFAERRPLVDAAFESLRRALAEGGVELRLHLGCEAYLTPDLAARTASGAVATLAGGRYVLVEFPLMFPPYAEQALFDLRLKGFVPVLAHVERYRFVQSDVNMVAPLIERGSLTQITAGSLLGLFGAEAQRTAEILIEHGLGHVLASDAHSATGRRPLLAEAVERAARIVGGEAARRLVVDVPCAIIGNEMIEAAPPRRYVKRPFFARWLRAGRGPA